MPAQFKAQLALNLQRAKDTCKSNRKRVLAHREIALCLCEPPLDYSTPEAWTGYIPPATYEGQFSTMANHSARRDALLLIMQAVDNAERKAVL
jgi:hypothetical protein